MESIDFSSITGDTFLKRDQLELEETSLTIAARDETVSTPAQTIFGRNAQTTALLRAYQHLLERKQTQIVIVHGESGSGKTALAETLREPVCTENNYFVTGKFFQWDETVPEPYSAIMAAFSDLCDLIIQSDDHNEEQQRAMKESIGADAQLLVKSISNLSPLVGDVNGIEAIEASSFAQFRIACRTFLRSVASKKHPVVVFLDDIQWADEGSIQLIKMFLRADSGLDNVMFVLAYRDEEAAHLIQSGMLDGIRDSSTDIVVSSLNEDMVHEMVTSIMGSDSDEIRQLSGLVAKRTLGNPLHVTMFMDTIQREALLSYDNTTECWVFDIDKIQYEIMVSETVAGLLTRKIDRISDGLTSTLKVASLLGYHFTESIILQVITCMMNIGERSAMLLLSEAVQEGFIEQSEDGYHFSHDKVQSAFKSLVDASEGERLHLLIGKVYISAHSQGGGQSCIYRAAVHLSFAPGFLNAREQRVTLARIDLEAARHCKEICAFEQAVAVLQAGLNLLRPEEKWTDELFALTFEMMETQARMQLIAGNFEACRATILEVSRHAKTAEMQVKLLAIGVEVRMAGNEVDVVVATANQGLSMLGFNMPRKVKRRHLVTKLAKVKFMLRHKTDEDLLSLPLTQDLVISDVVKLLLHLCTYCLMKNEKEMAVFSALLATELTLKHGLSQHSPCAFVIYGVAEVSLGNIDRAYRFGKLALVMLDRMISKEGVGPTVAYALTRLSSFREPLHELVAPLRDAANSGFQNGDVLYGTFCMSQCYSMQVTSGKHLADAEVEMQETYARVYDLGQDGLLRWLQPAFQYIINMQTDVASWDNIAVLTGDIMNEVQYFSDVAKKNHQMLFLYCSIWKARLAVHFGQFSLADSIWKNCKAYGTEVLCLSWAGPSFYFNQALVKFGLYELTGLGRQLRKGRKYKRMLQGMHVAGRPNAAPLYAYIVAHEASLQKKNMNAAALRAIFKIGLDFFVASGHVYLEGLMSERAGFCYIKLGLRSEAEVHFSRALHIYRVEWGAIAKYNQLTETSAIALRVLENGEAVGDQLQLTGTCISVPVPLE